MLPNEEVFKFLRTLSLFGKFFSVHMKCEFAFLQYAGSFILVIAIVFSKSNLFWDCANGFVNIFSVHYDFNASNNFTTFLNVTYSFVEVNVDVDYDGNRNFSKLINKSKPGSNCGSKDTTTLHMSVFNEFIFSFADKTKT